MGLSGSFVLFLFLFHAVVCQFTVWQVTTVFSGVNCSGQIIAQFATPIVNTQCPNVTTPSCQITPPQQDLVPNANATTTDSFLFFLPFLYTTVTCSNYMPDITLAYRIFLSPPSVATCNYFVAGAGFAGGCTPVTLSTGNALYVQPTCYTNRTQVVIYQDQQCQQPVQQPVQPMIDIAFNKVPGGGKCVVSATNNQTYWFFTCPNVQ